MNFQIRSILLMEQEFLENLDEIIEANIENERFGVAELAEKLNISRSNLHRTVKSATKLTASQYLNQFRLKYAFE